MKITLVESPYRHLSDRNAAIRYATWCLWDSCNNYGECGIASHLIWPQIWAETPAEREKGLACRDYLARRCATQIVLYTDLGESPGMRRPEDPFLQIPIVLRRLPAAAMKAFNACEWPQGSARLIAT